MVYTIIRQFINICKKGYLEEAKLLFQLNPTIDISADDEDAFRFACKSGNLELVKWLLEVKPDIDISIENDKVVNYLILT